MSERFDFDDPNISKVALKTFFRISSAWGLKPHEEKVLLGEASYATINKWRDGAGPKVPRETIVRISYVLGVYKSLKLIFQNEIRANQWIKKPNRAFDGKSALNVMLAGGLADVRRYLQYHE